MTSNLLVTCYHPSLFELLPPLEGSPLELPGADPQSSFAELAVPQPSLLETGFAAECAPDDSFDVVEVGDPQSSGSVGCPPPTVPASPSSPFDFLAFLSFKGDWAIGSGSFSTTPPRK